MMMSQEACSKSRALSEGLLIDDWVVLPDGPKYKKFWAITVVAACVTAVMEPFLFAFREHPGLSPYLSPSSVLELALLLLFSCDLVLNFFVAFHDSDHQLLVTDLVAIRARYLRRA
ncbi:uncharacterized protein HaLaN_19288, partial [Haematococcus lacustris]